MGGISIPSLLIILAIIVLLFGTKRLRNIGSDVGNAVKGFKKAMSDNEEDESTQSSDKKVSQKDNLSNSEESASEKDSSRK